MGLPIGAVRALASWKEVGLVVLIAVVGVRSITGRVSGITMAWPDFWIIGIIGLAAVFFAAENNIMNFKLPLSAEILGFRQTVFFMLTYFLGRCSPGLAESDVAAKWIFRLLVVTSVIGLLERFLISPQGLVTLGVAAYFQEFLGVPGMTVGNEYGLPLNYFTGVGNRVVRRIGSVYLGGQGFAIPFLLFFPIATAFVFDRVRKSALQITGYIICFIALLLTLTRMTIVVSVIQLILYVVLRRRPQWTVPLFSIFGVGFVAALVFLPGLPTFVLKTLSGQESSSASHLSDWSGGALAMMEQPWGHGLGTADQVAMRFQLTHITGDNMYLTYGVQFGILGLFLLLAVILSIMMNAYSLHRLQPSVSQRRMGLAMFLACVGLMLNGMTAVVFTSMVFAWIFFWLAGAVVTSAQNARQREATPAEIPA